MAFTPNSDIAGLMEGEAPLRRQAPGQVLNLTAPPDFRYKHHPMRWECVRGRWLPQLAKLKLEPGVNGIAHDLGEAQARENARQIGWQILDQDHLGFEYVRRFRCRNGYVHLPMWTKLKVMPGNSPPMLKPDLENFDLFRQTMIDQGIINAIDEDVRQSYIDRQEARCARLAPSAERNPMIASELQTATELLEMMKTTPAIQPKKRAKKNG